jgi:hypothetical protein
MRTLQNPQRRGRLGEEARARARCGRPWALATCLSLLPACEGEPSHVAATVDAAYSAAPAPTAAPPPEPPRAPDIIVDATGVSIGADHVQGTEIGSAARIAALLSGSPAVAGQAVDFVALRNAKPSQVAAVASALRHAKASRLGIKTEGRDATTQRLGLSAAAAVGDCTTAAWIAKDGAIDVWPSGGGTAKRIVRGMAGPDMTLGSEAVLRQAGGCSASELVVGADDRFPWGLVFDLATLSIRAPGSRTSAAVLVMSATPGRKIVLDSQ